LFRKWFKTRTPESWEKYKESRQYVKKVVSHAKECKSRKMAGDSDKKKRTNISFTEFKMAKEKQEITGSNCLNDLTGKLIVSEQIIKDMLKPYMAKLMNEDNNWDNDTFCEN